MCASLGDQVCGPHQKVRHPPQSGWLDERGRLKGGHSGSSVVALWRAGRKAAGKALRPPPVCVVQGTTAYRRPTAPAVTFALFNRDWRGCDKGFQGNGQTSSSLTGRTSGLPFVQLREPPARSGCGDSQCREGPVAGGGYPAAVPLSISYCVLRLEVKRFRRITPGIRY